MLETDTQTDFVEIRFAAGLPGLPPRAHVPAQAVGPAGQPVPAAARGRRPRCRIRGGSALGLLPGLRVRPRRRDAPNGWVSSVADDAIVLAVVTLRDRPDEATLNLLGPIVVNRHTHEAAQIVLPTTSYSVRAPLAVAS